jgi:hypothetical protein
MDLTPLYAAVVSGTIALLTGIGATMKVFGPQWLAQQLEEKKSQMDADRADREARIRAEAEEVAYERNRRATHEDRTHEMLYETLDFIKRRMEKEDEFRDRQLDQFAIMAEGIRTVGNRYNNLYSAQTLTNQQLAVLTDSVRQMSLNLRVLDKGKDNGNTD